MKKALFIWLLLQGIQSNAQEHVYRTEFDTLERYENRTLVNYRIYLDSVLTEEAQAFLYPTIILVPKYRLFPNRFKKEVDVDSIAFHGSRITYLENRYYKTENYEFGNLLSEAFYSDTGQPISKQEFSQYITTRGPCGDIVGRFIYYGTRKKKNQAK